MAKSKNVETVGSKMKHKKQSPKQAIVKIAKALIRTVQKYKLPLSFQKKLARDLGSQLQKVETFSAGLPGCCYVVVDGSILEIETTKLVCTAMSGTFVPGPCP
jgi:hypothetical protein